jgi:pimeloyl-ACP methyl ester carboxylesterase
MKASVLKDRDLCSSNDAFGAIGTMMRKLSVHQLRNSVGCAFIVPCNIRTMVLSLACADRRPSLSRHGRIAPTGRFRYSSSSSSSNGNLLHYEWVYPRNKTKMDPAKLDNSSSNQHPCESFHVTVVLHGLLGNLRNVKTLATRLCERQQRPPPQQATAPNETTTTSASLLIDLTGHGQSASATTTTTTTTTTTDLVSSNGVTTVADVARDVDWTVRHALAQKLATTPSMASTRITMDWVGHSLGGRVALHHAATTYTAPLAGKNSLATATLDLRHVWLLDTVPHALDASVRHVLDVARRIQDGTSSSRSSSLYTQQRDLAQQLQTKQYGLSLAMAQWLATQYSVTEQRFVFDLDVAESLVQDFVQHDFWDLLTRALDDAKQTNRSVHLIVAGQNPSWTTATTTKSTTALEAVQTLARTHAPRFTCHVLPAAGHWVHVDDLPGVLAAMESVDAAS